MDSGDEAQACAEFYLKLAMVNHQAYPPGKKADEASNMTCIDCGAEIQEERRMVMPGCMRCVLCQAKIERGL